MKIYIDCEFNGYRGQLISMALVDANGREWYCILRLGDYTTINPWVMDNVIPRRFDSSPSRYFISVEEAQRDLELWLKEYDAIHVIADWPDDIKYFCEFLITGPGTRIDTPPLTMEIRRDLDSDESEVPHNALADARAIRQMDGNRTWTKGQS